MSALDLLAAALADRYRLERELGEGGMATVYLAHDLKHERKVAIKVLKPELGAVLGAERFLSEIKVTANLQHPNLLPLFDSGEAAGLLFYVMPYVEGETLRARLSREKQLPVDEAVRIAAALASALHHAHERGVIHRDLKPENILLQAGQPVIADFGIALAVSNAGGARVTQTGLSLGTPQYMSPEQATGDRQIDARSDIYALGAVTFELLAGDPPHVASTAQAIVAKVLTEPAPSLLTSRPAAGDGVASAVAKALEKLPADRWSTAAAFAEALQRPSAPAPHRAGDAAAAPRPWSPRSPIPWAAALMLAVGGGGVLWQRRPLPAEPVIRFSVPPPEGGFDYRLGGVAVQMDLSPDGTTLLASVRTRTGSRRYLRTLSDLRMRPLPGIDQEITETAFSPSGRWLAYRTGDGRLMKLDLRNGTAVEISNLGSAYVTGVTWLSDEALVYSISNRGMGLQSLQRVSASGGNATPVLKGTSIDLTLWGPRTAPDGRHVFFCGTRSSVFDMVIGVVDTETGDWRLLPTLNGIPLGMVDRWLVFTRVDGAVMAAPMDLRRMEAGTPVATGESMSVFNYWAGGALSPDGTLAYSTGGLERELVLADGAGSVTAVPGIEPGIINHPRFSPDGGRIAFERRSDGGSDIWVADRRSGTVERLTRSADAERPEWSADGRFIAHTTGGTGGAWIVPSDGSGERRPLITNQSNVREVVLTPDGKSVVFRVDTQNRNRDLLQAPIGRPESTTVVLGTDADEKLPRLSPDGRWLAYVSNEAGREMVYLRALQPGGGRSVISTGTAGEPLWSRDGTQLYYRAGDTVFVATLDRSATPPTAVARRPALVGTFLTGAFHPMYDVEPGGTRFLTVRPRVDRQSAEVVVVRNWGALLRQRMAEAR